MSESGSQITLKQLLSSHQYIQIPLIQRDYAQGRPTAKDIREEFLNTLQQAFMLDPNDNALPLNLDFIYGSVEKSDISTRFQPLDGQQRLTTLFLLHWYLAWRDDCQDEFRQVFCKDKTSRFSYSVRPSSTEFFDELVNFWPEHEDVKKTSLDELITDQSWYFRHWRLDPTIQSSLTMLKAIHERFADITEASYERLMDEQKPVITFQLLELDKFGLSDDLYIKMNARGKPLTAFETFKARFEHDLKRQFTKETRALGDQTFSVADYFARCMDTHWADFFWPYRDEETCLYDDAIMNFFHVVAFICRSPESSDYEEEVSIFKKKPLKSDYALYHDAGWLEHDFSSTLILLLETWSSQSGQFTPLLPDNNPYFNEKAMFQRLVTDPLALTYTDLVQVFSYVAFLREAGEQIEPQSLLKWMRVIHNLSINTNYERHTDMQRSLQAITRSLLPHAEDILCHFASSEKPTTGFNQQQISEEKFKAELLLAHRDWGVLIERAEQHGYFKGQIEFLLEFSGALARRGKIAPEKWKQAEHIKLQKCFSEYLGKAEKMFNTRGLNSLPDYRWERALLSLGDYFLPSCGVKNNYSFLVNSASEQASWKRLLRGDTGRNKQKARVFLHQLLEYIDLDALLENQIDELIASAKELEPWRQIMVNSPAVFDYCGEDHTLRWDGEQIYLLKKSRINGEHAELFSYHLHLRLEAIQKKLLPLQQNKYLSVKGAEYQPAIWLIINFNGYSLDLLIFSTLGHFRIQVSQKQLKPVSDLKKLFVSILKFKSHKELITLDVEREDIDATLYNVAKEIKALSK